MAIRTVVVRLTKDDDRREMYNFLGTLLYEAVLFLTDLGVTRQELSDLIDICVHDAVVEIAQVDQRVARQQKQEAVN
jgi:hypothetical protein